MLIVKPQITLRGHTSLPSKVAEITDFPILKINTAKREIFFKKWTHRSKGQKCFDSGRSLKALSDLLEVL